MTARPFPDDPHSYAEPNRIAVRHLSLDLTVHFDERRLSGLATLDLERHVPGAAELVLDTWKLDIAAVTLGDGTHALFELGEHDPILGRSLTVHVGDAESVVVHYATHPEARAVQWMEPAQTASRKPLLFTQSEAILARSWIPIQDTPAVRLTYDAVVRVPPDLLALMSAENPTERSADGVYRFAMGQRVPSYLVALAVGDLEFRSLGSRSGVYAEPSVVEAAAWEFADTEEMMAAAERLYGPYRWDRYDLLVLPSSFPYGGMENPRLTFVTPTVLAGDRSLVSLVAHELAHSWSGNLVTNATWNDMWLNEGFTVYFETRIDEEVYGEEFAAMIQEISRQDLLAWLPGKPERDTWLKLDLAGRDPDEAATPVAYDKGSLFLRMLEHRVGRHAFDSFLAAYFARFSFQSMDTATFVDHLTSELLEPAGVSADEIQLEAWVFGPGIPDNAPDVESSSFRAAGLEAAAFVDGHASADALDAHGWNTHQWVHFLRALPRDLESARLAELDSAWGLSRSGNGEILATWFQLAIDSGHVFQALEADEALGAFLTRQGRLKFLKPLYTGLAATPEGLARAKEIFAVARKGYHPISASSIEGVLESS
jgi:leukotriene-A4 hydrolase